MININYMKTKKLFFCVMLLIFSNSVLVAQSKKEIKRQERLAEYAKIKKMVQKGQFVFMTSWVVDNSGQRFEARGEGLLIEGDQTYANFPFVGNVNKGVIGGDKNKIEFKTNDTVFDAEYNDKKRKIFIRFDAEDNAESYNVTMTILGNGTATVRISSSSRGQMSYEGNIQKVVLEDSE